MRSLLWLSLLVGCTRPNPLACSDCDGVCTPRSCAAFAGTCGLLADGCGGTVSCGCDAGASCMLGVCKIVPGCTPATCGISCGQFDDGCGGSLVCGCSGGTSCVNGQCTGVCTPATCAAGSCGVFDDGCGHSLTCDCPSGSSCSFGQCFGCTPAVCLAGDCGTIDDGCGHNLDCGPCSAWTAIGNLSTELRRVFFTSSGLWIADFTGSVFHSSNDSVFDSQKVQTGLSEIFADGDDVWVGGFDGISHKGPGTMTFTLAPTSPQNTGGLYGTGGVWYGVTAGTSGSIVRSTDGLTWSTVTPSPAPASLFAVFSRSANDVFVVGGSGTILHTTDGVSWSKQTSGVTVDLAAVWGSGSLMVATGGGGTILRSTNLGVSWTKATSGTTNLLYGVWGTGVNDIWASGASATILHSTDGGVTWTRESGLPIASTVTLFSVFAGGGKVYVVGQNGTVLMR